MMKFQNPDNYDSNWEWCRQHSRYHFDYSRKDVEGEWYHRVGRFVGDWGQDLQRMRADHRPITWATRKFYGDDDNTVSPMLRQEENDLRESGAPIDLQLTDMNDTIDPYPMIEKIADYWEILDAKQRVHWQMPGQMFNLHIDKLWERCPEDPTKVIRITVHLTDWEPGQFMQYGTAFHSHWTAGDAHVFKWADVPHATANASRSARPTLQITGVKSDRTQRLLDDATADSRYYL